MATQPSPERRLPHFSFPAVLGGTALTFVLTYIVSNGVLLPAGVHPRIPAANVDEMEGAWTSVMKSAPGLTHFLRILLVITTMLALPASMPAQTAVPVHLEPRHHLVLDSTRFRILDVRIPPGDTSQYHIHGTVILYVAIEPSNTSGQLLGRDWLVGTPFPSVGSVRIDSTYATQPITHRVTNPGPRTFHLLAVTSLGVARGSASTDRSTLPGTIELESSWFEQARTELSAGATTPWHTSPTPVLVVQPRADGIVVEREGGTRQALDGAGGWVLMPARTRYRVGNAGSASATAVVISIR